MPFIRIDGDELDVPRNLALLDTNFLLAAFNDGDENHENVQAYIELNAQQGLGVQYALFVTLPVMIETWGMLSSHRRDDKKAEFLNWITDRNNVEMLSGLYRPSMIGDIVQRNRAWITKWAVDYVDAHLMKVADTITRECNLAPSTPIITFDSDFFRCSNQGYQFSIYDVRTLELVVFS